jgi:hypothetical protein
MHRRNKVDNGKRKTLVCRKTKSAKAVRCDEIRLQNVTGKLVYRPDRPLSCGAVAWIEVDDGTVVLVNPEAHVDCSTPDGDPSVNAEQVHADPAAGDVPARSRAFSRRKAKRQGDAAQGRAGAGEGVQ